MLLRIQSFISKLNESVISLLRILLSKSRKSNFKQVAVSSRETCFIFGNGPSLKADIEGRFGYFHDKTVMVVNHFASTDYYVKIKPTYYCAIDPGFFRDNANDAVKEAVSKTLSIIKEKTDWEMYIVFPNMKIARKKFQEYFKDNRNIKLIPICITNVDGFKWFKNLAYKNNLGMPSPRTVVNAGIFTAINLRYKEIYVLGIDHSWHKNLYVDENNDLYLLDGHFYEPNPEKMRKLTLSDMGHLYNRNCSKSGTYKVHEQLRSAARALESHHLLNEYANTRSCKIYNASSTSFVDAYERCKIKFNS